MDKPQARTGTIGSNRQLGQRTIDRILGLSSVTLGITVLVFTQRLPTVATFRDVGPTFFPTIIGWGFFVTGITLLLVPGTRSLQGAVGAASQVRGEGDEGETTPSPDDAGEAQDAGDVHVWAAAKAPAATPTALDNRWCRFGLAVSLTALYVYLLRPIGFVWLTVPYLLAMGLVFGSRNALSNALMAFAATALLYLVFRVWLRVPLPL